MAARREHCRLRSHVEHVPEKQTQYGNRAARYCGARKVLGQDRMVAALYNTMELARGDGRHPGGRDPEPGEKGTSARSTITGFLVAYPSLSASRGTPMRREVDH